jgi:plasmid stability protein
VVANVHIREVPDGVVRRLKRRAARRGWSLNAELVATLEEAADSRSLEEVFDDIHEFAKEHPLPPWAPKPEDLIREDRDSR